MLRHHRNRACGVSSPYIMYEEFDGSGSIIGRTPSPINNGNVWTRRYGNHAYDLMSGGECYNVQNYNDALTIDVPGRTFMEVAFRQTSTSSTNNFIYFAYQSDYYKANGFAVERSSNDFYICAGDGAYTTLLYGSIIFGATYIARCEITGPFTANIILMDVNRNELARYDNYTFIYNFDTYTQMGMSNIANKYRFPWMLAG